MNQYDVRKGITNRARVSLVSLMMCGVLSVVSHIKPLSQTAPDDSLTIERPDSIDDGTWKRLRSGFEDDKQRFAYLLRALDTNRIDYTKDSMPDVIQKQHAMERLIATFKMETVRAMAQFDLLLNYVFIRNETSPRLTGRVIKVGPQEKVESLSEALSQAQSGDCILLGKGVFEIGDTRKQIPAIEILRNLRQPTDVPTDIAIIGEGRDATKIKIGRSGEIRHAVRWRISDVSIDCGDSKAIDFRKGSSFEFLNCKIFNYGPGTSGYGATLVVENSEMDGNTGQANGRGGCAFRLEDTNNLLYLRKVHFEENSRVITAFSPLCF